MDDSRHSTRIEGADLVVNKGGESTTYDAKFLLSVLLVYVAKGDGEIQGSETDRMIDIISTRFDASGAEAMGLLTDAVRSFTDGGDLVEKLRGISKGLSETECSEIFGMLLDVIKADGELADGEVRTVEFAGKILGLSQDAIHTGIRAARQ
jgi:uncharacterized tellurite resistance protein B-like protein